MYFEFGDTVKAYPAKLNKKKYLKSGLLKNSSLRPVTELQSSRRNVRHDQHY